MNDGAYQRFKEVYRDAKVIPMWELLEMRESDEQRSRASVVLGPSVFACVSAIVGKEPVRKQAAFYETICTAALSGYDFSEVESIKDIADVYAHYFVRNIIGDLRE